MTRYLKRCYLLAFPSVLPDISPARGEIGSLDFTKSSTLFAIGENRREG